MSSFAQIPVAVPPPPPPGQQGGVSPAGGKIKVDVNLVVLHTTVLDDRGKFVEGLTQENFRVYEDKVEQKLSIFKREDIPVSMGLVIDNSGSMSDKRPRVNEAALTLVQSSNPQDEAFVVNFNDDFYLDLDKDFSNSIPELKEALERIDSRGSTALYDAIIGSLDHLKKGVKEKKVLLIVTDGEDNTSRNSLEKTIREIQKTDTVIYTIGLLSQENKRSAKTPRKRSPKLRKPRAAWHSSRKMWMTFTPSANRWPATFATSTRWPIIRRMPRRTAPSAPSMWMSFRRAAVANSSPAPATATTPPTPPPQPPAASVLVGPAFRGGPLCSYSSQPKRRKARH